MPCPLAEMNQAMALTLRSGFVLVYKIQNAPNASKCGHVNWVIFSKRILDGSAVLVCKHHIVVVVACTVVYTRYAK